jgi:hypothetical protein
MYRHYSSATPHKGRRVGPAQSPPLLEEIGSHGMNVGFCKPTAKLHENLLMYIKLPWTA